MLRIRLKMENETRSVYETRKLFGGTYVTKIKDRQEFSKKYNFHILRIRESYFDEEFSELVLGLEKSNGSNFPYAIVGKLEIEKFLANDIEKIEVFIEGDNIKGICPVYRVIGGNADDLSYGNNSKDWRLEDCVCGDFDEDDYWKFN